VKIEKATLSANGTTLIVDFNPDSLSIRHQTFGEPGKKTPPAATGATPSPSTRNCLADQTSSVTSYSSKISQLELLFDSSDDGLDVRKKTLIILKMMTPVGNQLPIVVFQWGTLLFRGRITGFTESLSYFSKHGVPLRARVNIDLTGACEDRASNSVSNANSGTGLSASASLGASIGASAGISTGASAGASFGASAGLSAGASLGASVSAGLNAGASIGATPLTFSQSGESLQSLSARAGLDWRAVAAANNIDNPRMLQAGAIVNLNVK
jgi:hypothetical protein